jgi:hypothetical protein
MATAKSILKNTNQEAVVKVAGTSGTETITLGTDLVAATQATAGETQAVNIVGLVWTGAAGGTITVTRNGTVVTTLQANAAGMLDFSGQAMIPENVNNTSDIAVAISGAQAECWIRLRKVSGYATKVETAVFGAYDDETQVGS